MSFRRVFLGNLFWGGLFGLVLFYLGWQLSTVILPPKIVLKQPSSRDIQVSQNKILIRGYVKRTYFLRINDELISFDNQGNFEKEVGLQTGMNIFIIQAKSRFGKKTSCELRILRRRKSLSEVKSNVF